ARGWDGYRPSPASLVAASGPGTRGRRPGRLFEHAAVLVDVLLGDDRHRDVDAGVDLLALLELEDGLDAGLPLLVGVLLPDGVDPAFVDALDRLGGQVPAEDLDLVGALLAAHRGNHADQRRLAGGVDGIHVRVGRHQVLGRRHRDVLDVLAVDRVEELDPGAA